MVSADKEINGTKMFSLPWKHEMLNYSGGQTNNKKNPEKKIYTLLLTYPCRVVFKRCAIPLISSTQNRTVRHKSCRCFELLVLTD